MLTHLAVLLLPTLAPQVPASFMTPCNAALLGSDTAHERPAARYVETTVCDPVARGSMYRAPIVVCDPEITDVDKRDTSTT